MFARLISFFKNIFLKVIDKPYEVMMNVHIAPGIRGDILRMASSQEGVLEYSPGSNKIIEEYHAYASEDNDDPRADDISWCSSFLCWVMEKCGLRSTNSRLARSWLKWGYPTSDPQPGDVVIFWRDSIDSWQGHVAIFIGFTPKGSVICLGGNQSNKVCKMIYSADRVLGYRSAIDVARP